MELFGIGVRKYLRFRRVRIFCRVFNNFADIFGILADFDDSFGFPWNHHPWIYCYLLIRNLPPLHKYIKVWMFELIDRTARIGLEIIEDSVFFLNYREKIELVCHQLLPSSEFLLLVPFLPDMNCMFHPRSSSGGDSKSYNYWLLLMNWCP